MGIKYRLLRTCGRIAVLSSALASTPVLADLLPDTALDELTGSNAPLDGPTVWNSNQEVSAISTDRVPDPAFQAKGIPLGAFRLFSDVTFSPSYDSNVFRGPDHTKGDFFFAVSPSLVLDYERENGEIQFYGKGAFSEFAAFSSANSDEYDFGIRGNYLVTRTLELSSDIGFSQIADPLSSPDVVGLQNGPTMYTLFHANGKIVYQPNRFAISIGGNFDSFAWFGTPVFGGGGVENKDRDNTTYSAFAKGTYHFAPGYGLFLRAVSNSDDYAQFYDRNGIHRSSHGYEVDGGVEMLLGNLARGEAYAGYIQQSYDRLQPIPLLDIAGIDFGAKFAWFPTEQLTVRLGASRQIEDTIVFGAAGGDDQNVNAGLDYEVTRRVNLSIEGIYDDTSYQGSIPLQEDKTSSVSVSAKWLISHYTSVSIAYEYSARSSSRPELNYDDNVFTISLHLQI